MPVNPFIQLLNNPIATLTLIGYLLIMLSIALIGGAYTIRGTTTLIALASREHRRGHGPHPEWWGEYADGWLPPEEWLGRAAKVLGVGVLLVWALATVVYMVS